MAIPTPSDPASAPSRNVTFRLEASQEVPMRRNGPPIDETPIRFVEPFDLVDGAKSSISGARTSPASGGRP